MARARRGVAGACASSRIAPGLAALRGYRGEWLRSDVAAGLSVAAVAIPTAIAYAQLAGFPAVVGLYASILPLVVYAAFGTSRQLIVNPDAATCAMVAAIVAPLAAGDTDLYTSLAVSLAVLTGLFCIVAGVFRLGFLAEFLGKPVLVGFMNGIAISIVLGQIGKVFGFTLDVRPHPAAAGRVREQAARDPPADADGRRGDLSRAEGRAPVPARAGRRRSLRVVVALGLVLAFGLDASGRGGDWPGAGGVAARWAGRRCRRRCSARS